MNAATFIVKPLVFPRLLSSRECSQLVDAAVKEGMKTAPLVGAWEGARIGDVALLSIDESKLSWLRKKIVATFHEANKDYRFDLSNVAPIVQVARYDEGGRFEWHQDCDPEEQPTKKLTMVVQLSERRSYELGDFEVFPYGVLPFSESLGAAIVFPSFMFHRASHVARGQRHALAAFSHGPCFR
jgi:PKHD-type hydroxylase